MFDLENEGLGHGVHHSQWSPAMTNINFYKCHILEHFLLALTVFQIFTFQNTWPWKGYNIRSGIIRWQIRGFLSHANSNVSIFKRILVEIATWKVWPWKVWPWKVWPCNFKSMSFEHRIRSYAIRWWISTSVQVILDISALYLFICTGIFLYADDLFLIAPSVHTLQIMLNICETEISWLDMRINVNKSVCMRFGQRFSIHCANFNHW